MKRFFTFITQLADMLGIVCLGSMALITLIAVFFRYILNNSLPWAEEVTRYLFIVATYMGISVVMSRDEHLKMEILTAYCGRTTSCLLKILSVAFSVFFFLWVTKLGWEMTAKVHKIGQAAVALPLQLWIIWAVMVLAFMMTALQAVKVFCQTCMTLAPRKNKEPIA